ncbi:MAG: Rpn family recombination-promoting nuclease/putative transposase [Magnetococcales bacterium]|nr:Rpn family recombination-promoting nuclease/putative transposase [Magnetococcales bacterium]
MKFIDPRIDFAFKKIFGSDDAKDILISFLESLLCLEGDRRLAEVTLLDPFLAPKIRELKHSILDVKCRDRRGVTYIVEMQVQKVAAFLKRIQYNAAKAYVHQIDRGDDYPKPNQVIAITITDFLLFQGFDHAISRHESRESLTGQSFLQDILHYFIELPKFTKTLDESINIIDQWIFFIKHADSLQEIPAHIHAPEILHAFEKARVANMTREELELYDNAGIAITDARGMIELAREEGEARGEARGIQKGLRDGAIQTLLLLLHHRFGPAPDWVQERIAQADLATLTRWTENVLHAASPEAVFTLEVAQRHP